MELDEPQALVHLLWLGASVDKKIADSEREYIQKVCSHENIPIELEELQKHHVNNRFDISIKSVSSLSKNYLWMIG